jgi:hypothetical protein
MWLETAKWEAAMASGAHAAVGRNAAHHKLTKLLDCLHAFVDLARLVLHGTPAIDDRMD